MTFKRQLDEVFDLAEQAVPMWGQFDNNQEKFDELREFKARLVAILANVPEVAGSKREVDPRRRCTVCGNVGHNKRSCTSSFRGKR